ncbi:MAG: hypothetical protein ACKODH_15540 [Limisphaerales bacterium]
MKSPPPDQRRPLLAFTLVETMVATLIIAILISLLMPAIMKAKAKGFQTFCTSNLRGVGVGLISYAESHDGNFQKQVPAAQGCCATLPTNSILPGGLISRDVRPFTLAASTLGSPKILTCPTDRDKRPIVSFAAVHTTNVSYFTSVRARRNNHNTLLSGDNHIRFIASNVSPIGFRPYWSTNRHADSINLVFSDGHVQGVHSNNLPQIIYTAAKPGP